jgi:hypothetical protein
MKYLAQRFEKGKEAVQTFLRQNHRYVKLDGMSDAHGDLIQYQADSGAPHANLACQIQCLTLEMNQWNSY